MASRADEWVDDLEKVKEELERRPRKSFNTQHPNIKLTLQVSDNGMLQFNLSDFNKPLILPVDVGLQLAKYINHMWQDPPPSTLPLP